MKKNIKKIIQISLLLICMLSMYGQSKNILQSIDIKEIEHFMETAHPDDPRRIVLNKKLVTLKNEEWVKGAKLAVPMAARKIESVPEFSNDTGLENKDDEAEEFDRLIAENNQLHNERTVSLLNALFENDITSSTAALLVKNDSDCNIIMRIKGKKQYLLPIKSRSENTIVVEKDDYALTSKVCGAEYNSQKSITKSLMIQLSN